MSSEYLRNLPFKMAAFHNSHQDATKVLNAYNEVDPFHCYYGDDCNPDEYLGYAERFLKSEYGGTTLQRVIASFHPNQFFGNFINDDDCEKIAALIDA